MIKFADDSSRSGLILKNYKSVYRHAVKELVECCNDNHLELKVTKTKELVGDHRKTKFTIDHIIIKGELVKMVESYKYLGTIIDNQLNWTTNVNAVCKWANRRLFFLRKLWQLHISPQILHQATIQSVVSFNQQCYHSCGKKGDMERLAKISTAPSSRT